MFLRGKKELQCCHLSLTAMLKQIDLQLVIHSFKLIFQRFLFLFYKGIQCTHPYLTFKSFCQQRCNHFNQISPSNLVLQSGYPTLSFLNIILCRITQDIAKMEIQREEKSTIIQLFCLYPQKPQCMLNYNSLSINICLMHYNYFLNIYIQCTTQLYNIQSLCINAYGVFFIWSRKFSKQICIYDLFSNQQAIQQVYQFAMLCLMRQQIEGEKVAKQQNDKFDPDLELKLCQGTLGHLDKTSCGAFSQYKCLNQKKYLEQKENVQSAKQAQNKSCDTKNQILKEVTLILTSRGMEMLCVKNPQQNLHPLPNMIKLNFSNPRLFQSIENEQSWDLLDMDSRSISLTESCRIPIYIFKNYWQQSNGADQKIKSILQNQKKGLYFLKKFR
ncbi:unnamed protein product (macronuclear) [Paramecium tetraurelia]|uniref:Uncharacterized protein n=1 Tax=Paramecium tetraurelia TaxID=5888 RepID=A0DW84_PARTE|nr:uncharacterized protein GSPATT00039804001 [Paramecium tetraurelia]CAK87301.1 unnamed protein product [Paramecium tetraurelia]|eukprot:XP_001454698.1 hypothetical protein (macronuclear) [Paramecium tetraurelia strain d4-2]